MKNILTIKGRITILLGSFFLLVIISVGVMLWSVRTQESDALIINMAGRQRMLSQKLTWLSLTDPENPEFPASQELFSKTLQVLRFGGETIASSGKLVDLPPAPDLELHTQLDEVAQSWLEFQGYLLSSDAEMLSIESPKFLNQLDGIVSAFETRAEAKNQRLEIIQLAFLVGAIILLSWGFMLTQRRIVKPLSAASRVILETQVAQRTRELVSAFEFSQEIVAEREQAELIVSVVERARLLMGADSAALCLLSPNGEELDMRANTGNTSASLGVRKTLESDLIVSVVGDGNTVSEVTGCADCAFLDENPNSQCVVTPLRAMDRTIGALCVVRSDEIQGEGIQPFDPDGQRALALLANTVAVAITNTRLAKLEHQQIKQEAALAEREELASNLHDDLAQTLSFTRLKIEQLGEVLTESDISEDHTDINQITAAIDSAYQQVRNALTGLLRPSPADADFFRLLTTSIADFNKENDCQAELNIINPSALEFPSPIQIQILHVVREALSNIKQHAHASQVIVHVDRSNGLARYIVEDDGIGFDPGSFFEKNHFGLQIMQTRIERSGGNFRVDSVLKKGTKVMMTFPIKLSESLPGGSQ